MNAFLELFGAVTLGEVVMFCMAIGFVISMATKGIKAIIKSHDTIQEKEQDMAFIKKELKTIKEDQDKFKDTLNTILSRQQELSAKYDEFEEESRQHSLNKLRDKLLQSYRFYTNKEKNPMKAWSDMEKEAFYNLFNDYEKFGGNGFMHSTVEPAMAKLAVISVNDPVNFEKLMESRKG